MTGPLEPRRLLLVEDDSLTAALMTDLLEQQGFDVQVAESTRAARQALDEFDPDAALLDLLLGDGPSGMSLAHLIAREYPATAIVVLTRYPSLAAAGLSEDDLPEGCGFLRKDRIRDAAHLVETIEAALRDRAAEFRDDLGTDSPLSCLTPNQQSVLRMVAQGLTNAAIAKRRGVSTSAVEQSLSNIFRSLSLDQNSDVNPRMQAARMYVAVAGLPEDP